MIGGEKVRIPLKSWCQYYGTDPLIWMYDDISSFLLDDSVWLITSCSCSTKFAANPKSFSPRR
jgi:hypothetical protein